MIWFSAMYSYARLLLACLLLSSCSGLAIAQAAQAPAPPPQAPAPPVGSIAGHPDWPTAKAWDVHSVDAIIAALYDVISGPAGQARDWNRFRSLFVPDARLIPVRRSKTGPGADVLPLTPEQYQQLAGDRLTKEGFF